MNGRGRPVKGKKSAFLAFLGHLRGLLRHNMGPDAQFWRQGVSQVVSQTTWTSLIFLSMLDTWLGRAVARNVRALQLL